MTGLQNQIIKKLKTDQENFIQIFRDIIEKEENDKINLANTLHRNITPALVILKLSLNELKDQIGPHNLNRLFFALDDLIAQNQSVSQQLLPPILKTLGLASALKNHLNLVRQTSNANFIFYDEKYSQRPPLLIELCLFKIVEKLIENILARTKSKNIEIRLENSLRYLKIIIKSDSSLLVGKRKSQAEKYIDAYLLILHGRLLFVKKRNSFTATLKIPLKSQGYLSKSMVSH